MLKNNFQIDKKALEKFLVAKGFSRLPEVEFCDKFAFVNGFYRPRGNQIKVFLKPLTPKRLSLLFRLESEKEFFAKVLTHELGHCFDKKMTADFPKKEMFEILSAAFLLLAILIGFLKILSISFWPIFFVFLPLLYLFYKLHPAEIRARRFSRDHWREVSTFLFFD